jgi:hypothetical protein
MLRHCFLRRMFSSHVTEVLRSNCCFKSEIFESSLKSLPSKERISIFNDLFCGC